MRLSAPSVERIRGRALQRLRSLYRDHEPLCLECLNAGVLRGWDELDHIVPLHKGGTYAFENLQGLCKQHHLAKTAADLQRDPDRGCDEEGNPIAWLSHWT